MKRKEVLKKLLEDINAQRIENADFIQQATKTLGTISDPPAFQLVVGSEECRIQTHVALDEAILRAQHRGGLSSDEELWLKIIDRIFWCRLNIARESQNEDEIKVCAPNDFCPFDSSVMRTFR